MEGDTTKIFEALENVRSLKNKNLFANESTAEIEQCFNELCNKEVRKEIIFAIELCLPAIAGYEYPPLASAVDIETNQSPSKAPRAEEGGYSTPLASAPSAPAALSSVIIPRLEYTPKNAGAALLPDSADVSGSEAGRHVDVKGSKDSFIILRSTLRRTLRVGTSPHDLELNRLVGIGNALLQLFVSFQSGVVHKMQSSYDAFALEVSELSRSDDLEWMRVRLKKELTLRRSANGSLVVSRLIINGSLVIS